MSRPLGDAAQRLLAAALALPSDERQALVEHLPTSLATDHDAPEDPALLAELKRRLDRYERVESRARPWPDVRAEIEDRLATLRT